MPAEATGGVAVAALGLTKRYAGRAVVDRVDVEVRRGECWGLLGPNGAGKTTFLRMLIGATPPSAGTLEMLGRPVPGHSRAVRAAIGVVPQHDNLDPDFTVAQNLRTYASYFGVRGAGLERRIRELLAFAALEARADAHVNTLSGGMQRRLTLVRALVNEPELLVLDEPTTGLDPQARQVLWQRLHELRRRGMTLLLTTHYMEEARRLCDRVTIMDHGQLLDTDSPRALIARHVEPQVIEVHGPTLDAWHEAHGRRLAERHERGGETAFYYLRDERPMLAALECHPELEFLHRPANLEDVFLKLTGRELRDA